MLQAVAGRRADGRAGSLRSGAASRCPQCSLPAPDVSMVLPEARADLDRVRGETWSPARTPHFLADLAQLDALGACADGLLDDPIERIQEASRVTQLGVLLGD